MDVVEAALMKYEIVCKDDPQTEVKSMPFSEQLIDD